MCEQSRSHRFRPIGRNGLCRARSQHAARHRQFAPVLKDERPLPVGANAFAGGGFLRGTVNLGSRWE